jgi:GTP-binding protein
MLIRTVEFAGAVASPGGPKPGDLTQVAFAGRSNVGKSSLINRLLGRTRTTVARVSATPGKTQEINFYRTAVRLGSGDDLEFFVVDLPGYGFARVPIGVRDAWRPLVESYLSGTPGLAGVVQLVDMRHDPTREDLQMLEYLAELGVPTLVALTKADKLRPLERSRQQVQLLKRLGLPSEQVISFSARTGEGRESLLEGIEALLTGGSGETD